jgi:hypothetical protein
MYERKLIEYIPHILRDVKEYKAILTDGEEPEISSLWDALDNAMNDQFIQDATENGISRWENMLKISPKATATLDERRFTILTKINEQLPFTITSLKEQLNSLCGADGYSVELDANAYKLKVLIGLEVQSKYDDVVALLKRVVPANLIIETQLKYNQHQYLNNFKHSSISEHTHGEIRTVPYFEGNADADLFPEQ